MDTAAFLRRIWPSAGLYVIARLTPKGFRHQVCDSIEEAAAYALQFDQQGVATYHACAAFREREVVSVKPSGETWRQVRTHKNVRALKCFFMDLDVGADPKKFPSQEAALDALVEFCMATGLPMPMVVSSGGGIHIYWTLTDEILPEAWKQTAGNLKALSAACNFPADPACTSDLARVLRPVGTANRKTEPARAVELVADANPIAYETFAAQVASAAKAAGITPSQGVRQVARNVEAINQAFAVQTDFPPCSMPKVADRCAQIGKVRDTRGQVSEPHWYAFIQVACHSIEGDALTHEWSSGHPGYSEAQTAQKIQQIRGQGIGPAMCATFADRNPGGCDGCPFKGKISSPAQLGTIIESAPPPQIDVEIEEGTVVTVTLPAPPAPFTRGVGKGPGEGGIYVEEEGITHKIYEFDCFPTELAYDEQLGYETMRICHWLPNESWHECVVRSALLAKPADFEMQLRDHHIQPLIRNKMAAYFDSYLRKLRSETKMRQLFKSQGWKAEDTEFVLGDKLYKPDTVEQAGFSSGSRGFLEHFKSKGVIEPWRDLTWELNEPGLEPHAFMLLTAFAAPLLKLDNRKGFTVSALGRTGAGKSTMGQFLASVYGHPEATWMKRDDTAAARVQRVGAYYSLPVYMDEITTIEPKELRALIYSIATGKGRDSLKQDRTLREGAEWSTILITSTNDSLQAKLQLEKTNAEAESMRLFEFKFPSSPRFGPVAAKVPKVVFENYGVAGERYIRHIVQNREAVRAGIRAAIDEIETAFGMDAKERFWAQAIALALYGGEIAQELGVIAFNPERVRIWLRREVSRMRKGVEEAQVGAVGVLADWLNKYTAERLVVSTLNASMVVQTLKPMRELSQRYEKDIGVLYISRKRITEDLRKQHVDVSEIRDELGERGILIDAKANKTLGAGTEYAGAPTACWKLNANHQDLKGVV